MPETKLTQREHNPTVCKNKQSRIKFRWRDAQHNELMARRPTTHNGAQISENKNKYLHLLFEGLHEDQVHVPIRLGIGCGNNGLISVFLELYISIFKG